MATGTWPPYGCKLQQQPSEGSDLPHLPKPGDAGMPWGGSYAERTSAKCLLHLQQMVWVTDSLKPRVRDGRKDQYQ